MVLLVYNMLCVIVHTIFVTYAVIVICVYIGLMCLLELCICLCGIYEILCDTETEPEGPTSCETGGSSLRSNLRVQRAVRPERPH